MSKFSNTLKISRSGLRLFLECPRCFWLDLHHKIKRPPSYPYTLASAVDYLVKQEFDKYRHTDNLPPVFKGENLDAKLYDGPELADWRNNFKGISFFDEDLNAMIYGAVDDVLKFHDGSLAVVDYKSSGSIEIKIYDDYQKQMDTYNYILQRMGHTTWPQAYFVFYQVDKTGGGFANSLPFQEVLKPVSVDSSWVGPAFEKSVKLARQTSAPALTPGCTHCAYVSRASRDGASDTQANLFDKNYQLFREE